jgi:exonuclease VII small subunit
LLSVQFIGEELNMSDDEVIKKFTNNLVKIVDTLEQRIAKLEKVLESHAKCIGEMRENKNDIL